MQHDWRNLGAYTQRQVIINTYQDSELIGRDGFRFEQITVLKNKLEFVHQDKIMLEISTLQYPDFEQLTDFPHHYAFSNEEQRLELYFV